MKDMELAYVRQLLDEHDSRDATTNQSLMLRDFRREVEAAIPGCRTTPRNTHWAWVYMPEDHIAMGAIGFGNFSQNGRGSSTYAVHSRTITNGKYNYGSKQHKMMMSSNRSVAVKNAKKFLRRLSPHELVKQTHEHVRGAIGQMRTKAREVVMQKEVTLFGANLHGRKNAPILTELKHLVDMGHTFLDASIADQLREYFVFAAENDEVQMPYSMLFVSITQSGDKQRFDVVPIKDAASPWPDLGEPETFYDDVPEHVLGRLAVLSMVEIGTFVPDVGLKHTERGCFMWLGERDLTDYRDKRFLKYRDLIAAHGWKRCPRRVAYWIGDTSDLPHDDNIYRVTIDEVNGHVSVACIGLESVDAIVDGNYDGVESLPDWMREKLTLLSMLSATPPTEPVEGVGRRINQSIYWVFC